MSPIYKWWWYRNRKILQINGNIFFTKVVYIQLFSGKIKLALSCNTLYLFKKHSSEGEGDWPLYGDYGDFSFRRMNIFWICPATYSYAISLHRSFKNAKKLIQQDKRADFPAVFSAEEGNQLRYVCTVAETWVQWRSDFQSGSRVLKKVLWTFSMAYSVMSRQKFAKNTQILKIADFAI